MLRRRQRLMPVWAQAMPPRSSTTMTIRWATLGGQDTGTERAIVDDENPLYSGLAQDVATSGSGMALVVATGAIVLVVAGLGIYWWMRRRKKNEQTATDSMNA